MLFNLLSCFFHPWVTAVCTTHGIVLSKPSSVSLLAGPWLHKPFVFPGEVGS